MVMTMRLSLAPASMFTDEVRGSNKKARALSAGEHQGQRAVVSLSDKATGVSALTPAPVFTSTHPGKRTTSKLARSLSPRWPGRSTHEAGNERPTL
jgi:hypothetical protein